MNRRITLITLFLSGLTLAAPMLTQAAAPADALKVIERKMGTGATATSGKSVSVHYTGWLYAPTAPDQKGKKFDSSRDRAEAFSFPLGAGRVIQGWDQGVAGMKVGGSRTLIIPAALAYGSRSVGNGLIPANSTLLFDVELVDVK